MLLCRPTIHAFVLELLSLLAVIIGVPESASWKLGPSQNEAHSVVSHHDIYCIVHFPKAGANLIDERSFLRMYRFNDSKEVKDGIHSGPTALTFGRL